MPLAVLSIDIVAKLAKLEQDMGRASHIAEQNAKRIEESFKRAGVALGTAFAGLSVGAAFQTLVVDVAAAQDAMGKLAERTGMSANELSKLDYAVKLNGASTADLEQALKGLSNKMFEAAKGPGDAAAAFEALKIKVESVPGKLRPLGEVFTEVAEKLSKLQDGPTKAALAMKLMEETGLKLIPTMNAGAAGIKAMGDEAERLGVALDDDAVEAAKQLNENFAKLTAQFDGFKKAVGSSVIPALAEILEFSQEVSKEWGTLAGLSVGLVGGGVLKSLGIEVSEARRLVQEEAEMNRALSEKFAELRKLQSVVENSTRFAEQELARRQMPGIKAEIDEISGRLQSARIAIAEIRRDEKQADDDRKAAADKIEESLRQQREAAARAAAARAAMMAKAKQESEAAAAAAKAYRDFAAAINAVAANAEAAADADAEIIANARKGLDTLHEQIAAQIQHNEEIGLTTEGLIELKSRRLEDAAAIEEQSAAMARKRGGDEAEVEAYEQKAAALRKLAELQRSGDVRDASVEAAEAAGKAWQDISNDIADSLTDAILAGGSDGWELLKRQIEATVIRATITPLIQGGVNSLLQSIGLGPGAGLLQGAAGSAMGADGILGGIGKALPWIGGGLLIADALGLFKGATPHRGGAFVADSAGGGFKATNANFGGFGLDWGAFRSDRSSTLDESVRLLTTGIADLLGDTAGRFGTGGSFRVAGRFAADGDDPSVGALRILDAAGVTIAEISDKFAKDAGKGFDQFSQAAGETVQTVLDGMDLPTWVESVLAELGQAPTLNEIATALNNVGAAIDTAFASISQTTAQSVRAIELSVLDAEGQYAYLDAEIGTMLERLRTATDPATITSLFNSANADLNAAFGLLDSEQQRAASAEFIDRFYELESIAQASLAARDNADAALATKHMDAADRMVGAAQQMLDAADRMQAASAAGEQMQSAADGMNQALRNIRINVGTLVSGEVG